MKNLSPQGFNGGTFDVMAYKAVGDGTTDDSTAIGNALTAAGTYASSNGGAVVVFPPAKYKMSSLKEIPSNVTIWAYGAHILTNLTAGFFKNYNSTPAAGYTTGNANIAVLGGTWDGRGQSVTSGTQFDLFQFRNARGFTVRDAVFRNMAGESAIGLLAAERIVIQNCRFEGYSDTSGASTGTGGAIKFDQDSSGNPVQRVSIQGCHMGPAVDGSGLNSPKFFIQSTNNTATFYYNGIRVIGNYIDTPVGSGIKAYGWKDSVISNNVITTPTSDGILLSHGANNVSERVIVTNNTILSYGARGVHFDGNTSQTFSGCICNGNTLKSASATGAAIRGEFFLDGVIAGNTINDGNGDGVYLNSSEDTVVGGNIIRDVALSGVDINACTRITVNSNRIYTPGTRGVYASGATTRSSFIGNLIIGASRTTNNGNGAMAIGSTNGATDNVFMGNRCQKFGSGNEADFAFEKEGGTSAGNSLVFNSFEGWSATHATNINIVSTAIDTTVAGTTTANNCTA